MPNNGQWTYSSSEEYFNHGEYFGTKEEAIEAGKGDFEERKFYIGQVEKVGLGVCVDLDSIFEHINQNMCDEVGECAEDYLMDVKQEHCNELEEEISEVIIKWIEKYNYQPTFFKVINIESVECSE
ncbi:hypothetical protein [Paenibacillus sp. FSL H3-0286]|uniref:hypothetical protein n=1 Tax=Paenibacillus sp. FSL H3-0286 TaxID=2921427 RepID=UPI003244BAC6